MGVIGPSTAVNLFRIGVTPFDYIWIGVNVEFGKHSTLSIIYKKIILSQIQDYWQFVTL